MSVCHIYVIPRRRRILCYIQNSNKKQEYAVFFSEEFRNIFSDFLFCYFRKVSTRSFMPLFQPKSTQKRDKVDEVTKNQVDNYPIQPLLNGTALNRRIWTERKRRGSFFLL